MRKQRKTAGAGRKHKNTAPRTAEDFFQRSEAFQQTWERIAHAVSAMRAEHYSLGHVAREYNLDRRTILKLGGSGLRKLPNGRYAAKPYDSLLRVVVALTEEGKQEVALRDSRLATVIAEHWNAVHQYIERGDPSALRRLRHITVTDAGGKRIRLMTDLNEIERHASAGVLSFESMYGRSA